MQPLAELRPTPRRRQRRKITTRLLLIVGALLGVSALTACLEAGDNLEIVSGTSRTDELTDELAVLGVTLPSDASQLRWLMANTWDTNDTYLRLTAPRSSILRLLRQSDIDDNSLMPLPQTRDYGGVLPEEVLSGVPTRVARPADLSAWSLREAEKTSAVAYPMDNELPSVGAIVLDPAGPQPTVILHWYR